MAGLMGFARDRAFRRQNRSDLWLGWDNVHLGVLNLLKMNGPISLHPMSLLFINTHFHI